MPRYRSHISLFDLASRSTRVVFSGEGIIEAPNWSRDGKHLLVNTAGDLLRLSLEAPAQGTVQLQPLGLSARGYGCNNDHDYSPDGRWIAFSATTPQSKASQVLVCDAEGHEVRLVTPKAPSYFHGWSPDGKWLAFVAERGDGNYELYRILADGSGAEERLTRAGGYDDGPEYSVDGRYIYFNSNRAGAGSAGVQSAGVQSTGVQSTGRWHLWRMPASGAGPSDELAEQVTFDEPEDWFPHFSPDGKWLLDIAFPPGTEGHNDRLPGMTLRLMPTPGEQIRQEAPETLLTFFGGQGSLNVNSWAPDSQSFAFVQYEEL